MRKKNKEIMDSQIIVQWLKSATICRVAFHDTPFPHIVPMNYGYKDNALYFHCAVAGRKIDLIRDNENVAFEIEVNEKLVTGTDSCQWTTHFQSMMGTGKIHLLNAIKERRAGLNILMEHHGKSNNYYPDKMLERTMVLRLDIISISAKQSGEF